MRPWHAAITISSLLAQPLAGQQWSAPVMPPMAPLKPFFPKTYAACSALQTDWNKVLEQISGLHQSCLDAHKPSRGGSVAESATCSRPQCQSLHSRRESFMVQSSADVAACSNEVDRVMAEERRREAAERARKDEEERQKREAEQEREERNKKDKGSKQTSSGNKDAPKKDLNTVLMEWSAEDSRQAHEDLRNRNAERERAREGLQGLAEKANDRASRALNGAQSLSERAAAALAGAGRPGDPTAPDAANPARFDLGGVSGVESGGGTSYRPAPSEPGQRLSESVRAFESPDPDPAPRTFLGVPIPGPGADLPEFSPEATRDLLRITTAVEGSARSALFRALAQELPLLRAAVGEVAGFVNEATTRIQEWASPVRDAEVALFDPGPEGIEAFGRLAGRAAPNERSRENLETIGNIGAAAFEFGTNAFDRGEGPPTQREELLFRIGDLDSRTWAKLAGGPIRSFVEKVESVEQRIQSAVEVAGAIQRTAVRAARAAEPYLAPVFERLGNFRRRLFGTTNILADPLAMER